MKKILCAFLMAALAISFVACSSDETKDAAYTKKDQAPKINYEEKLVGSWVTAADDMMLAYIFAEDDENPGNYIALASFMSDESEEDNVDYYFEKYTATADEITFTPESTLYPDAENLVQKYEFTEDGYLVIEDVTFVNFDELQDAE